MSENITKYSNQDVKRILDNHLDVGLEKPISYLPIRTVTDVVGISVAAYRVLIEKSGAKSLVFYQEDCCIKSGAVYAYHIDGLRNILEDHRKTLIENGWPVDPLQFITRIAAEWLDEKSPVLPVVRSAFGDSGA